MRIQPQTAEDYAQVSTISGMRARIGEFVLHDGMTRNVFAVAGLRGMSEYETMVLLAYHALCGKEEATEQMLEHMNKCTMAVREVFNEKVRQAPGSESGSGGRGRNAQPENHT